MYEFSRDEKIILEHISAALYMEKPLFLVEDYVKNASEDNKKAYKSVFDEIYTILNEI